MTKLGEKLIAAAKEAVNVAKCEHDLIVQPRRERTTKLERYHCVKCRATIWEPIIKGRIIAGRAKS